MRNHVRIRQLFVVASLLCFSFFQNFAQSARILVFSKTAGFRHASIEAGKAALWQMGRDKGFAVDTTENASVFTEDNLKKYNAVVFLSTTGNVLDPLQQNAFERYIQAGGGFMGIHAASDTEYDWAWYGELMGGYFDNHPSQPSNVQQGDFHIADRNNALTSFLPEPWVRKDEFYAYKSVSKHVKVLITIDEKSYIGGTMGDYHPMSWYHEFDGGRAFYSNMGHTPETFSEPLVLKHFWAGLEWAMGGLKAPAIDYSKSRTARMPEENRFTKIVLEDKLDEPMELALLPDKKVLFIERKGAVKLYDPAAGKSATIANIAVSTKYLPDSTGKRDEAEDGLLGLTLDPNFEKNNWIYLYYSPAGDDPVNILTRYDFKNGQLLENTKKVLLEVKTQRDQCCHTGGSMAWDANGNLFLSTGDNTSPRADGYAPIDERPGRSPWDAQKSSGNTNDLRGKIIRIHPEANGTYTIPEGNLFPKGTVKTRPEIYTMGHRNPFRIDVDKKTGYLYWGEVGPDASKPDEKRGPEAYDEVGQARKAGNFGWPYQVADNKSYYEYDYATKATGGLYSVEKPINNSPNNSGLLELPPAQKAFIWYPYGESKEFPLVGTGGRNAMAGPVFYSADFKKAARPWPAYYDKKLLIYDWMRGWIMAVTMNESGDYTSMEPVMPSYKFSNPMDMVFAPDGDLYMLEYGTGWFQANDDARLIRIEYNSGNRKPVVEAVADKTAGSSPLTVNLSAGATKDYDGDALSYEWTIAPQGKGKKQVFKTANPKVVLSKDGVYTATLKVTDAKGASNSAAVELVAGNEPPMLEFDLGGSNKSFFFPGNKIKYNIKVSDKEDGSLAAGTIMASEVAVNIDYLAEGYDKIAIAQGHKFADGNAKFATAQRIMSGLDCNACHKQAEKSIGPNFKEIAKKYEGQEGVVELLSNRIINGSTGVWGEVAMAAHPTLSNADAAEMVHYILSFADEKAHPAPLPVKGEYETKVPENSRGNQGVYILRAAYKDRGAGILPPLSSEQVYILQNPNMAIHGFDYSSSTQKMTFGGNNLAIPSGNNAYIGYKSLDFKDVVQIQIQASAPKKYNFIGGTVEIHIDQPTGPMVGQPAKIEATEGDGFGGAPVQILISNPPAGQHDVYFVFKNDTAAVAQSICVVNGIVFQDANMQKGPVAGQPVADAKVYVGKYKFTGMPFEFIEITADGTDVIMSNGADKGPLTPLTDPDRFDAGGKAIIQFIRNGDEITGMKMIAMGMEFLGTKQ